MSQTKLTWDYQSSLRVPEYHAEYKGLRIRAVHDESPSNPFEEYDGHWPMVACAERGSTWNYDMKIPGSHITDPFDRINDHTLVLLQKHLAEAVGMTQWTWVKDVEAVRENIVPWCTTEICTSALAQWARLYEVIGIPCLHTTVHGYSQGDWAELLIVATPEAQKHFDNSIPPAFESWTPEHWQRELQQQADLYKFWAFGDVYGYIVEARVSDVEDDEDEDAWEEITDGSCWGYYGDDFAKSGLEEAALAAADYHLKTAQAA